jgi:serine/threonine protein kinase
MADLVLGMSKVVPKSSTSSEFNEREMGSNRSPLGSPIIQRSKKSKMGASVQDFKINFFRPKSSKSEAPKKQEDIGISFFTLHFMDTGMEERFRMGRRIKYRTRLRFGAAFTAFFIPLLVIMQVSFKTEKYGSSENDWTKLPLVIIFPGIVMFMGILVIVFYQKLQENSHWLALISLIGQVSAIFDTTAAGTSVSEKNVWVQFIFSLGITSGTGLTFVESFFILFCSSFIFILLAWIQFFIKEEEENNLSSAGTLSAAVVLYSILLIFLCWNWEYEERRDFILTERLAKENVLVQMTMEMTGWFRGGVENSLTIENNNVFSGVLNANTHIDPKDVLIKEELGQGTFGCVYAATWKETKVAVKKITLQGDKKAILTSFGAEASVMAQLRHPNVVMFMGVMVHPEFVGIFMELCPKGSVYNVLHRDSSSECKIDWTLLLRMLLDASRGMHFLHSSNPPIIHRDLKSVNLLIDADWRCKVSDFGLSKLKAFREEENNSVTAKGFIGSSIWIAPEIFKGEQHTEKSDVYSFGIILFEALTGGKIPYDSISMDAISFVVQAGKRPIDFYNLSIPEKKELQELYQIMIRCWQQEEKSRPSFSNIISILQNILTQFVGGHEKWEDHIIYPDRKLTTSTINTINSINSTKEEEFGLLICEKDLIIDKPIGRGVFGIVYQGSYFGTPVAIKKLHVSGVPKNVLTEFEKECTIMRGLHHPNIVLFMGSCSKPPTLLLVTELLSNGSFFDIYHQSNPPESKQQHLHIAFHIAFDMAKGLAYLHNHNPSVIHRDLKSQNILLDDKMRTKIADFGLSKFRDVGKTMSICGSPLWVAPEVLRGEKYGCPCDVYSFSIIVWEALAWGEPYPHLGSSDIMNGVACGNLRPNVPEGTPFSLATLLEECWMKKQDSRPTFNEIVTRLEAMAKEFQRY